MTVPLRKRNWLPTIGRRSVVPILRQIDRTIATVREKYNSEIVNSSGHSARGWTKASFPVNDLETPHRSQEGCTKRNLNFVQNSYPDAFYPEIQYICVAVNGGLLPYKWRIEII